MSRLECCEVHYRTLIFFTRILTINEGERERGEGKTKKQVCIHMTKELKGKQHNNIAAIIYI